MVATADVVKGRVGVAPGTTTVQLGSVHSEPYAEGCENPDRVARQKYILNPPGKVQVATFPVAAKVADAVAVLSPYANLESLKGAALRGLGYLITPVGDNSPNPSYELIAATKTTRYCTRRPEKASSYRWENTASYGDQLGAVPTDLQLSTVFQYTPVISQWIPFQKRTWSPAPFIPPTGPSSSMPQDQGFWTAPTAGLRGTVRLGDVVTPPPPPVAIPQVDAGTAAVEELRRHQDRMYLLGIVSAAAVASTAIINVFRYNSEKRDRRKAIAASTRSADVTPTISGSKRRKRRRH